MTPPTTDEVRLATLQLEPVEQDGCDRISVPGDEAVTLGRSARCDIRLADDRISRIHARIEQIADSWIVTDLGSRHGTFLNDVRLSPEEPAPLQDGDLLRVGPRVFRVVGEHSTHASRLTTDDVSTTTQRVERVGVNELSAMAQHRLTLLIECAASINSAADELSLAACVIEAVTAGAGFPRAALLRPLETLDHVEVLAQRDRSGDEDTQFAFSRSLLSAASCGQIARLKFDNNECTGESIDQLGIHSALCVPVCVGETVAAFLYLDAREHEPSVHTDAVSFCQAIAKLCGLAMANLKRQELERWSQQLELDVAAAREAQETMMPPAQGHVGQITYAMLARPGRLVAGDLFDVIALEDGRVGAFLGDVSGKGVGAAILMAMAQTHLGASLLKHGDPAAAMTATNRYIAARTAGNRFITLWLGLFDPGTAQLCYVDAGHGHWLVRPPEERPRPSSSEGGTLVGIDPETRFTAETLPFPTGSRLIVFSDGVVEQPDPSGEAFGLQRAIDAMADCESASEDVQTLFAALECHATGAPLGDDVTIASIQW